MYYTVHDSIGVEIGRGITEDGAVMNALFNYPSSCIGGKVCKHEPCQGCGGDLWKVIGKVAKSKLGHLYCEHISGGILTGAYSPSTPYHS